MLFKELFEINGGNFSEIFYYHNKLSIYLVAQEHIDTVTGFETSYEKESETVLDNLPF